MPWWHRCTGCATDWPLCERNDCHVSIAGEISMPMTAFGSDTRWVLAVGGDGVDGDGYAKSLTAAPTTRCSSSYRSSSDIQSLLAGQSGAFIDAARQLVTVGSTR